MIWEAAILNDLADAEQDETARLRRLDAAAVAGAVNRYQHRLYRYLYRLVRDAAAADDLFQQTWLNVVRQMGKFDGRGSFDTWLFAIAHNAAMDLLRRRIPEALDESEFEARSASPDGFAATMAAERTAALESAMAALPPLYREVLTLRFEEGMKLEEIALVTHAPLSTVKSRLQRGLEGIRQYMAGRWTKEDLL